MRKKMMMLGLIAVATGAVVHAEEAQAPAVEAVSTQLNADEQAFAAKLTDKNRKSFGEKFSADQRKAIMVAVNNGANADIAVQNMLAAQEIKAKAAVAQAETADMDEMDDADFDEMDLK